MSQSILDTVANAIRDSFNSNDIDPYPIAKAAIEAMREPTREMLLATQVLPYKDIRANNKIYKSMIEAALNEK